MEEDKIKELFREFNPELSPSDEFIDNTINKIESFDKIKSMISSNNALSVKRCVISAFIGFVCGVFMSIFFSYIRELLLFLLMPLFSSLPSIDNIIMNTLTWVLISIITLSVTLGSYRGFRSVV